MIFNKFLLKLTVRVLILVALIFILHYALNQEKWYMVSTVSTVLIVVAVTEMVHFQNKTNREYQKFIDAVIQQDFTINLQLNHSKTEKALKKSFHTIIKRFQELRIDKEMHYQYLNTVFETVNIGLISFNHNWETISQNTFCKELFQRKFKSLDELKHFNSDLAEAIQNMTTEKPLVITIPATNEILLLSVNRVDFKLKDDSYHLISLQNIRTELEEKEMESWKKLIRVLTHEIMNSVTPISSLSESLNETLADTNQLNQLTPDDYNDLTNSLLTIEDRSKSLLRFVKTYKDLTRMPVPKLKNIKLADMFHHLNVLFEQKAHDEHIKLEFNVSHQNLEIMADNELMGQVLINLIINAFDAVKESQLPTIRIIAFEQGRHTFIQVRDNGTGIPEDELNKVFIPFFTTKKQGSGIGLSLSREIIRAHGGTLSLTSVLEKGTDFTIRL